MNSVDSTCISCPAVSYSLNKNSILVTKTYCRVNNITDLISYCSHAPQSRLGGTSNQVNETCDLGHIGAYCEACDLYAKYWNESFSNAPVILVLNVRNLLIMLSY